MQGSEGSENSILVYWLNLTNKDLSIAEALSLSKMCDEQAEVVKETQNLIFIKISSKKLCDYAYRIAFNKQVGVLCDIECLKEYDMLYKVESNSLSVKKKVLSYLLQRGLKLDKNAPNKLYILSEEDYVFIKKTYKESDYKERYPDNRPGFLPFSLKPRIAQALLNLAQVRKNHAVLDPFAGVGGLLLEIDFFTEAQGYGVELYNDVLWKAIKNKRHYGCNCDLIKGDATALPFKNSSIDAIVSDLPYGRSSRQKKQFSELYALFFEESWRILRSQGKMVIMVNTPDLKLHDFKLEGKYGLYAHRTLTRYIYVLKK